MEFIATNTIKALRDRSTEALPHYETSLQAACEACPPPFGEAWYGDKYREFASDPVWLVSSLIANAEKEGYGSRKLWELAARAADVDIGEAVRQHAIDESRHALLYVAICDLVFPGALEGEVKAFADSLSPRYSPRDFPPASEKSSAEVVLDELIQMNIGEIRTRIHQLLMRPVITAYCPADRQERLQKVLDSLMDDETRHIEYTARLINKAATRGYLEFVRSMTHERLREFCELTLVEVGEARFVGE